MLNALALVDGCPARDDVSRRKACAQARLISTAKKVRGEVCVFQHGRKGFIDDAVASKLRGAEFGALDRKSVV